MLGHLDRRLAQHVGDSAGVVAELAQRRADGVAQAVEGEAGADRAFGLEAANQSEETRAEAALGPRGVAARHAERRPEQIRLLA